MGNFTPDNSEILLRFLDGELQGPEKKDLEVRILSNWRLQEELASFRVTIEAVKLFGLQQMVAVIHQEMIKEI